MKTAEIKYDQGAMHYIKVAGIGMLMLGFSVAAGLYLLDNRPPPQSSYQLSCIILFLASINLGTVIMMDPFQHYFSRFTPAAIIGMAGVIFLFIITESVSRFLGHIGYSFLTPFLLACQGLIYTTIVLEKSFALKCLLCLDSVAVVLLWDLGAAGNFMLPF